jgi:hypothetical protein
MSFNRKYVRRQLHSALANSLAFDSAEREGEDNPVAEFIELLRDKVDAHTLRAVIEILQRESPGAVAAEDDAISNPSGVRGCKPGGALQPGSEFAARQVAEDTAAYLRRFPNGDRADVQRFGVQPPSKP